MKQSFIFKDPSLSLIQIIRAFLCSPKRLSLISKNWLWGSTASQCLFRYLKTQKIPNKANICCPAYICDSLVAVFISLGIEVRFYRLHNDLTPDLDHILALTDHHTWAWIGVNYFGFPTMGSKFIEEGKKHNILIIEDNAHGWLSRNKNDLLGFGGDIGIFSPRKTYPLPEGGCIWIRDSVNISTVSTVSKKSSVGERPYRFLLKRLIWNLEEKTGIPLYSLLKRQNIHGTKRCKQKIKEKRETLSLKEGNTNSISTKLFHLLDNDNIVKIRRINYLFWLNNYHRLLSICGEFFPVFSLLEEGVCPLVFPVLVQDPCTFEQGCSRLGIETVPWPGKGNLPPEVKYSEAGEQAEYLAGHIWTLPVHQTVNPKILNRKISSIL